MPRGLIAVNYMIFFYLFWGGGGEEKGGGGNLFANFTFMNNQNIIN